MDDTTRPRWAEQSIRNLRLERAAEQLSDEIENWFKTAKAAGVVETRTEVAAWLIRLAEHLDMDLFPESAMPQRGEMRQELMEKLTEDWGASFAA